MRFNQNHQPDDINQIQPLQRNYQILVEIAHSKLEFNHFKKIKMSERVKKILDINWTLQPVQYQINLTANRLWMSSKLCAEITYTRGLHSQVLLQTIYLPWKTTTAFEFIAPVIFPKTDQKHQYQYSNHQNQIDPTIHYEQTIYHNESPVLDVVSTRVVTAQTMSKTESGSFLLLDINSEIEYRILQKQFTQNDY